MIKIKYGEKYRFTAITMRFFSVVLFFLVTNYSFTAVYAKESSNLYNEAYRIEKISPILAINLYESILSQDNPNKKTLRNTINRLFFLYIKFKRFEEIFVLNSKFPPDKIRQKKTESLIRSISSQLKIEESAFQEMISIALRKDENSRKELLSIYNYYPNHYLLRYMFAIKFQTGDLDSLAFLISEIPDLNPVLKLAYIIKASNVSTTATGIEKAVKDAASISSLTDAQKSDILYFYAKYFRNIQKYRQSIRYFRMSSTYTKKEDGIMAEGMVEVAKTLFITGKTKEACALIQEKINVQNESDDILQLFCKNKSGLRSVKRSIKNLSEKDPDLFYKKAIQVGSE